MRGAVRLRSQRSPVAAQLRQALQQNLVHHPGNVACRRVRLLAVHPDHYPVRLDIITAPHLVTHQQPIRRHRSPTVTTPPAAGLPIPNPDSYLENRWFRAVRRVGSPPRCFGTSIERDLPTSAVAPVEALGCRRRGADHYVQQAASGLARTALASARTQDRECRRR